MSSPSVGDIFPLPSVHFKTWHSHHSHLWWEVSINSLLFITRYALWNLFFCTFFKAFAVWSLTRVLSLLLADLSKIKYIKYSSPIWCLKSPPWGWWNTGTGCSEKLWMPRLWKHSRTGWTGLWATWSSWWCPCSLQGGLDYLTFKGPFQPNYSMVLSFCSGFRFLTATLYVLSNYGISSSEQ